MVSISEADHLAKKEVNKNANEPTKWLRSRHVRRMLGISDSTLQTLRINGSIKAYKLGASWFYREDEIISALEASRTGRKETANE
jgi:hypothetical protein